MKGLRKIFLRIFLKIFNCASIYLCDLSQLKRFKERDIQGFEFKVYNIQEIKQLKEQLSQERGAKYLNVIDQRIESQNYICFAFINIQNKDIAYTRWACTQEFYSKHLNLRLVFKDNEIFTLNSYTHPTYRYKGLHKEVNVRMLNYFIDGKKYSRVYLAVNCFLKHLTDVIIALGYKRTETRLFLKRWNVHLITLKR